ncbi:gephyrin-like molybdotransferase Glp [Pseudanabaena sp. PCC 6802]|uniref:molybdopterin molybdotransferase MoeA n=1 Tax=Pseudanabaena sp. PCC 6802 TaxID=118173 RepID=UPI00034D1625|nr:gephyrin-like molybdotransferase Glp [Pseudanabaena sp. PCC 6802]
MITVTEAETCILNLVQPFEPDRDRDRIALTDALGRVLARDVASAMDFPHFDNSAMDGYALRYEDLAQTTKLSIVDADIPAGTGVPKPLERGQCARIFTGGMLPEGADTVVMQEDAERDGNSLNLKIEPQQGDYVRRRGEFYRAGSTLIPSGARISASELGVLAAAQCKIVDVYRQPVVAILSTGSELVDLYADRSLTPGQIIDSNQYALTALVKQAGAIAYPIGIVPDRQEELLAAITRAIAVADVVISSGGVSVGDYDYVDRLLDRIGADICIRACAIKPGKPLTVATIPARSQAEAPDRKSQRSKLYFGVPGNPASAMVCFWRFVRGAIAKLGGAEKSHWHPKFIKAIALGDLHAQGRRETYLWGNLSLSDGYWQFTPASNYSSGNPVSLAGTNGLAVLRVNQTYVPAGDEVLVMSV